tara:strand:+ start:124 stop:2220 length:2097 start_codon:yes stop_codon:yes gene_type:complete
MLIPESVLRSVVREAILKEQPGVPVILQVLVADIKSNPQKYLSSKRNKLETVTWKGKKYRALGFLEKGNPVALIKKSDLKPQDASTAGPFELLGQDKVTLTNAGDNRKYDLTKFRDGKTVTVSVRDNAKSVKVNITKVDYGDPSVSDWAIEVGSYVGMIPGVGTPVDLGSAVLAVIKDPPDYLLGALCVLCSAPVLGLAAGAAKIAGKGVIKKGATTIGKEVSDEAIEKAAETLVNYLKSIDAEISEKVFSALRKQLDSTLEYLEKQMKKFAQDHDLFGLCALTEQKGPGGCSSSVVEATKRFENLAKPAKKLYDAVLAELELKEMTKGWDEAAKGRIAYAKRLADSTGEKARKAAKTAFQKAVYGNPAAKKFFTEDVVYVHVVGAYRTGRGTSSKGMSNFKFLDWLSTNPAATTRSADEISVFGIHKSDFADAVSNGPLKGKDFFVLGGRLTYFSPVDAATELTGTASDQVKKRYASSGLRKKPLNPKDISDLVVDEKSFRAKGDSAEAILGNWKIKSYHGARSYGNLPTDQIKNLKKIDLNSVREIVSNLKNTIKSGLPPSKDDLNAVLGAIDTLSWRSGNKNSPSLISDLRKLNKTLKDNSKMPARVSLDGEMVDLRKLMPDFAEIDELVKEANSLVSSLRLPPVPGSKPGTKGSIRLPMQNADIVIYKAFRRDQKDFTLKDWVSNFADRLEKIK